MLLLFKKKKSAKHYLCILSNDTVLKYDTVNVKTTFVRFLTTSKSVGFSCIEFILCFSKTTSSSSTVKSSFIFVWFVIYFIYIYKNVIITLGSFNVSFSLTFFNLFYRQNLNDLVFAFLKVH